MNREHLIQSQFLEVIDRDEAERRFRAVIDQRPLEPEAVLLDAALGRVLATDIAAPIDVPGFDRSNVDGFAVHAADTFGASEEKPRTLMLNNESLAAGTLPRIPIAAGTTTPIATGAVIPRGADAVVMVEHTDLRAAHAVESPRAQIVVSRPVSPGANITFAGTDIGRGETVLRRGVLLTSRETGVLAALGIDRVDVIRRARVAIISTGDELLPPGARATPGMIFDSNATVLGDAVRELGALPVSFGIVPDNYDQLMEVLRRALDCDMILLSGGTSKGAGDLSYRVVGDLGAPGIVAHGVALKPGKPLCLGAVARPGRRPIAVAVLPGFPTSAIFAFHEFIAPVLRRMAGKTDEVANVIQAVTPQRINSERGRTEYVLVGLMERSSSADERVTFAAYPMGKGSGSVTAFGRADGFIVIPRQREYLEAGEVVDVQLLGGAVRPADLVVIGSHCIGLDWLLGQLHERGYRSKFLAVGSTGGLNAAQRGECDVAGIHLLDEKTGVYNQPFVGDQLELILGYGRKQGIVFRRGDHRFSGCTPAEAMTRALADPDCVMVNRNRGSGTRVLIDRLLGEHRPSGYWAEARSHHAVAAAVAQSRADWGVAISSVASDLGFIALQDEQFDFAIPRSRRERPAVRAFHELLAHPDIRVALQRMGFFMGESYTP